MPESNLLHELIEVAAARSPKVAALTHGSTTLAYRELHDAVQAFAAGLMQLGLTRGDRVGIYLEKRFETVIASFGAAAAGMVFVPLNPLLKATQVGFILRDCNVRALVTSPERLDALRTVLGDCPDLRHVVLTERAASVPAEPGLALHDWQTLQEAPAQRGHRVIDTDMAAILYTSGSTGKPKGVVLSHRNMVAGGKSVASYLENHADDVLLAALPLSFDAGFSQLTTAFHSGARVVLLNYLLPRDVLNACSASG